MAREDDLRSGEDVREDVMSAPGPPEVRRDRREHGGAPERLDDDALAERTEQERVDAGIDAYDPGDVPAATDDPVPVDITETEQYQDERAEIDVETEKGLLSSGGERPDFPPSRYPDN
ncbi:MAG TPA: hypothetical protein VGP36_14660 [Mycobacteriales bacterium]|jgi:hypothetical protein|nr:hypothetical protein [Mycobacteriales bacterium]